MVRTNELNHVEMHPRFACSNKKIDLARQTCNVCYCIKHLGITGLIMKKASVIVFVGLVVGVAASLAQ